MKKQILFLLAVLAGMTALPPALLAAGGGVQTNVVDGGTVVCTDGVCLFVEDPATDARARTNDVSTAAAPAADAAGRAAVPRLAQGYMDAEAFLAFLRGETAAGIFAGKTTGLILLLVLLGGLAMNLTPCVLPMVPINLMIIGKSAARGAWYGAGIAVAYGVLGVLAALGGLAFGEIQSSAWFNGAVAVVFVVLALSLLDVFFIDFSKHRAGIVRPAAARSGAAGCAAAFFMGALSAVLAGACVAPVLISVLLLTADLFAKGVWAALGLPFVMGVGMALPWPFAGAGMQVLPKPGGWMTRVNRVFALVVLAFAARYAYLAFVAVRTAAPSAAEPAAAAARVDVGPDGFAAALASAARPVLVDCWASWCKNCTAMEKGTLRDPRVVEALAGYTVIRLRAEDIRALRALPGFEAVKGLPAFVIFP